MQDFFNAVWCLTPEWYQIISRKQIADSILIFHEVVNEFQTMTADQAKDSKSLWMIKSLFDHLFCWWRCWACLWECLWKGQRESRKKETRRSQKLIKNQQMLIYLNKNICLRKSCQILKIILMILDQEVRSSKKDSVVSAMTFIFIESIITCFHLLLMKIEFWKQRSKKWWRKFWMKMKILLRK